MLATALIIFAVAYLLIGLALTAFCVHMSYHEAAIGVGRNGDEKARGVLESRWGFVWLTLLVVLWPLALALSAFVKPGAEADSTPPEYGTAAGPDAPGRIAGPK